MPTVLAAITGAVVDEAEHVRLVSQSGVGAVVTFLGTIRDHDPEAHGTVATVDYSHHPDAQAILDRVVLRVLAQLDPDEQVRVAVSHRVGLLSVGDVALICCAASAHRGHAFGVCAAVVEAIKANVPIWKHQVEVTGRSTWSRLGLNAGDNA